MSIFTKIAHLKNALFSLGLTLSGPDVPAWAPEGREGQSQAGPKGPKPAPRAAT